MAWNDRYKPRSRKKPKKKIVCDLGKKENYDEIDPEVRPVIKLLYGKGFKTYQSCQGHSSIKGYPGVFGYPQIIYKSTPALDRAFKKSGFIIEPSRIRGHVKGLKIAIIPPIIDKNRKKPSFVPMSLKDRKALWKKTYKELSRLRGVN
jgi:hypothetical protein